MKRLLIFLAVLSAIACTFAICASAAEIPDWTNITEVSGMPDKSVFGDDGKSGATSRVLMSDGVTYPAYYICKNSTSLGFSYSDLNSKTGKSYTAENVVRIELPKGLISSPISVLKTENGYTALVTASFPEGFTTMNGYTFKATDTIPSALVSVTLPSTLRTMGQAEFIRCAKLESLTIPEGVTTIPKEFAYYATSLKTLVLPSSITTINESAFRSANLADGIVIPEGCESIGKYAFKGTSAPSVVILSTVASSILEDSFSLNDALTYIHCKCPNIAKNMFGSCPNIQTVILENTVSIGELAFCNPNGGTTQISTLILPEGLTSISSNAFVRSKLKELVLPSTLTTLGESIFASNESLEKVVLLGPTMGKSMFLKCTSLKELVLTENFQSIPTNNNPLDTVSEISFITYYTGTDHERIKSVFSVSTRLSQAKYYSYEDYKNENYTYNKYMMIYDANLCEVAFDGVHSAQEGEADCVNALGCSRCPLVYEEALGHEFDTEKGATITGIIYESFGKNGYYEITCARCIERDTNTTAEAIFIPLGFSVNPTGTGFATGFKINQSSLDAYEQFYGEKVNFGIVIFNPNYLGADSFFTNGKLNATKGAVQVSMSTSYSSCNLSVNGFTPAHSALELAFAGYAYIGEDIDSIQLIQKEYIAGKEPVYSPISSSVVRGEHSLYTVTLGTVTNPTEIPPIKEDEEDI